MPRTDQNRLEAARQLLAARRGSISAPIDGLMENTDAMRLLTQRSSSLHKQGDYAAHYLVDAKRSRDIILYDVQRSDEKTGMLGILEFVEAI